MDLELSEDTFRALARSSPWRWTTLQFEWELRRGGSLSGPGPVDRVRAWIRLPSELRVEDLDGNVVGRGAARTQATGWTMLASGVRASEVSAAAPPVVGEPTLRPDGLVAARPWPDEDAVPFFQNYIWMATLDPAEIGGEGVYEAEPWRGVELTDLTESVHRGRRVWDALVRPTDDYQPRCSCCALLDTCEGVETGMPACDHEHAEATLVRLDVETGICVQTRFIGGVNDGDGHMLTITAVDEPMDDALFVG